MADEQQTPDEESTDAGDAAADATVEQPAVEPEPAAESEPPAPPVTATAPPPARSTIDRRSLMFGAGAVAVLLVVFLGGIGIGSHHDRGDRARFSPVHADRFPDGRRGGAPGGEWHMHRGRDGGRGPFGRGGGEGRAVPAPRGEHHMGFGIGGHGGAGVVTDVSDDELTLEPLAGRIQELVASIDEDTKVQRRGTDGSRDVEDAEVSDIDEGDIAMVFGRPDVNDDRGDDDATARIDAKVIVILRDGDE